MDIRYISWAGYDLIGAQTISIFSGTPEVSAEVQGRLTVSIDATSSLSGPNIGVIKQSTPTITSKTQYIKPPTATGKSLDYLRPFPKPRNI